MRRAHRKLRTGCSECKRRRVKCDEAKPRCRACIRNELQCNLAFLTPNAASLSQLSMSLNSTPLDARRQELLNNFTHTVYMSVSAHRAFEVWQTEVPRMALANPFLMHGTLAVSALHLARTNSLRRAELFAFATQESQRSMSAYRPLLSSYKPQDIHAVFAFSGMVHIYILASLSDKSTLGRIPSRNDQQPHWFLALRGLVPMLGVHWDILQTGPFAPVFIQPQANTKFPAVITGMLTYDMLDLIPTPDDIRLNELISLLTRQSLGSSVSSPHPGSFPGTTPSNNSSLRLPPSTTSATSLAICLAALEPLRRLFSFPFHGERTWIDITASVRFWPGVVTQDYMDLLFDRVPEALVIFAYYCVLIKRINSCWYFQGVGEGMLNEVSTLLKVIDKGDGPWGEWIKWAIEEPLG